FGDQLTVEFWMKADLSNNLDKYEGLVASDFYTIEIANGFDSQRKGVLFCLIPVGWPMDRLESSGPNTADPNGGGAVVTAGEWHHVAGTYDGKQIQLYIDGQPWGKPAPASGAVASMLPDSFVSIGSHSGRTVSPSTMGNRFYKGLIDEVSIYNRALSPAE